MPPAQPAATRDAEPTGTVEQALAHAARLLERDPALAEAQARAILEVLQGHPAALRLLASARSAQGDLDEAIAILGLLAQREPRYALAQHDLGLALVRRGDGAAAITALRRALALKPDLPQAWRALGDQLAAIGDDAGAADAYVRHVRHSTRDPGLLAAASALAEDRIPEAEVRLRAHLKQAPTDVAAIRMFAELAMRLGRNEEAEPLLARCLALAPGFDAARFQHALVLHRLNRPEDALAELDALLAHAPANPGYQNLKAVVLCRTGDYATALALYDDLLARHPAQPRIWMSYGHALKTAGHQPRAIEAYRRALAMPEGFGEVWWSLANLKTFRFDDDDLAAMRAALARPDLGGDDRQHLEFALGKALEDRADYPASFAHYARGNALRRATLHYRAEETTARVQRIREDCDAAFFAQRAGQGCPDPDPIFIVGLPRAGSTLLEQILSSHSQVEGTMELPEITTLTRQLRARGGDDAMPYQAALATLDADELRALGEQYLARTRIQRKLGRPFFIDKMPNNFLHVGLIHLILPNARIIDARRHPLACCFSGFKQHFARGQGFSYALDDLGRYYRDYVALMAHFDAVLPGRVHRVVYERMVDDTEAEVRRLLDHCGLPFEDGCLRFFENTRAVRTASSEQVRQPIYREGVDHWRHYRPWLSPLEDALGPVLDAYPDVPREVPGHA